MAISKCFSKAPAEVKREYNELKDEMPEYEAAITAIRNYHKGLLEDVAEFRQLWKLDSKRTEYNAPEVDTTAINKKYDEQLKALETKVEPKIEPKVETPKVETKPKVEIKAKPKVEPIVATKPEPKAEPKLPIAKKATPSMKLFQAMDASTKPSAEYDNNLVTRAEKINDNFDKITSALGYKDAKTFTVNGKEYNKDEFRAYLFKGGLEELLPEFATKKKIPPVKIEIREKPLTKVEPQGDKTYHKVEFPKKEVEPKRVESTTASSNPFALSSVETERAIQATSASIVKKGKKFVVKDLWAGKEFATKEDAQTAIADYWANRERVDLSQWQKQLDASDKNVFGQVDVLRTVATKSKSSKDLEQVLQRALDLKYEGEPYFASNLLWDISQNKHASLDTQKKAKVAYDKGFTSKEVAPVKPAKAPTKQATAQEPKVGDTVYNALTGKQGIVYEEDGNLRVKQGKNDAGYYSKHTWLNDAPMEQSRPSENVLDTLKTDKGIDYEKFKDVAGRVERGELTVDRLDRQGERGRVAGGQRALEASVLLGANERGNQKASQASGSNVESRGDTRARQERLLENYAKQENIWFDWGQHFGKHRAIGRGGEAFVYRQGDNTVVKAIDYHHINRGLTPQQFIDDRIALYNHIFPETPYKLVGFTRDHGGKFRFLVEQPFINVHGASRADVDALMKSKGFEPRGKETYTNGLYIVHDVHEKNAAKDANGNVYVIDAVPKFVDTANYQDFDVISDEPMERSREETKANKTSFDNAQTLPIDKLLDLANPRDLVHEDGIIDMSDVGETELIRRVMGNAFGKAYNFYGIFTDANQVKQFVDTAKDLATQADENGYDGQKFRDLAKIVDDASKANGTVIFHIDEDALPEEKGHRALYLNRTVTARANQIPAKVLTDLHSSPVVQKALHGEEYKTTQENEGKFGQLYGTANKSSQMEEFALKSALGQWDDLGLKEADQRAAAEVAMAYLDAYAEHNATEEISKDQLLRKLASEIQYAKELNEIQRTRQEGEKGEGADIQSPEDSNKQAPEGAEDRPVSPEREQYVPTGEERLSQTPISAREKAGIPLEDDLYTSATNQGQIDFAERQLAKGLDKATKWFNEQIAEGNFDNGATGVVGLHLMNAYGKNGNLGEMNKIAEKLVPTIREAAQSVQAMRILSKFDPVSALTYATMQKLKRTGQALTDREVARIQPKIQKVADTETDKAAADGAFAALKQELDNANVFIKDLEQTLKDAEAQHTADIEALKKQIEKKRPASKKEEIAKRLPDLEKRIKSAFNQPMQSAMDFPMESKADDVQQDLIDVATYDILDYKTPEEVLDHLNQLTGGITPEDFADIQLKAFDATRTTKTATVNPERDAKVAARNAHRKMASMTRAKTEGGNRFEREVISQGKDKGYTDNEILGAILMPKVRGEGAVREWYKNVPDATEETFRRSAELRKEILADIREQQLETKRVKERFEGDLGKFENQVRHNAKLVREARKQLNDEFLRLQRTFPQAIGKGVSEGINLFKGLSAWGEISYVLRQGFIPLLIDTRAALKGDWQGVGHGLQGDNDLWKWALGKGGFADAVQYLSDHSLGMFVEKVREHPRFIEAQNNGVRFSQIGDFNIADDHFSTKLLEHVPLYRRAEVAYTLPGDLQRLYIYDNWAKMIEEQGLTKEQERIAKKYAAETANAFTGKGDMKRILAQGGAIAKLANILFFSPQLLASRFQSAWRLSTGFATAPKGMRMQMAKKGLRFYAILGTLMYLAGAVLDPDDDDFGKVNVKPDSWLAKQFPDARDLHIDFMNGMDLPIQNTLRLAIGLAKAVANGDKEYLNDEAQAIWNKLVVNKQNEPRFARSKLSPAASMVWDAYEGKDFLGRPVSPWGSITSRIAPLAWQQTYDALLYDRYQAMEREPQTFENAQRKMNNEQKIANALFMMMGTFLGAGITQYPKDDLSKALQLARQESNATSNKDDKTRRTEGALRNLFKAQIEALQNGNQVEARKVGTAINEFLNRYPELKKEMSQIMGEAKSKTGLLSYYAKDIPTKGALERVRALTNDPDEIKVLDKLIKAKDKK